VWAKGRGLRTKTVRPGVMLLVVSEEQELKSTEQSSGSQSEDMRTVRVKVRISLGFLFFFFFFFFGGERVLTIIKTQTHA
jgi:hypothetical protein